MDERPRILIIDGSPDVMIALEEILADEGFAPSSADFFALRATPGAAERTIAARDPHVVVVDIAPDYEKNLAQARAWQASEAGAGRAFIFTTTNATVVRKLGLLQDPIEILGKPYDLGLVVEAVCRALRRTRRGGPVELPTLCEGPADPASQT